MHLYYAQCIEIRSDSERIFCFKQSLSRDNSSITYSVIYSSSFLRWQKKFDKLSPVDLTFTNQMKNQLRDHPFKTSAFFRGGGVKIVPNLATDSSKKLPTVGG